MSQDLDGISLSVPCFGLSTEFRATALTGSACCSREESASCSSAVPAAGTFWQDSVVSGNLSPSIMNCPVDGGGLLSMGKCKMRAVTVAYVVNSELSQLNSAENMALQCLKDACDTVGSKLEIVQFGKLDFGETMVLDQFYNAGESR